MLAAASSRLQLSLRCPYYSSRLCAALCLSVLVAEGARASDSWQITLQVAVAGTVCSHTLACLLFGYGHSSGALEWKVRLHALHHMACGNPPECVARNVHGRGCSHHGCACAGTAINASCMCDEVHQLMTDQMHHPVLSDLPPQSTHIISVCMNQ